MLKHRHKVAHSPSTALGIAVCECGATARMVNGQLTEEWHTCELCVPRWWLETEDPGQSIETRDGG